MLAGKQAVVNLCTHIKRRAHCERVAPEEDGEGRSHTIGCNPQLGHK